MDSSFIEDKVKKAIQSNFEEDESYIIQALTPLLTSLLIGDVNDLKQVYSILLNKTIEYQGPSNKPIIECKIASLIEDLFHKCDKTMSDDLSLNLMARLDLNDECYRKFPYHFYYKSTTHHIYPSFITRFKRAISYYNENYHRDPPYLFLIIENMHLSFRYLGSKEPLLFLQPLIETGEIEPMGNNEQSYNEPVYIKEDEIFRLPKDTHLIIFFTGFYSLHELIKNDSLDESINLIKQDIFSCYPKDDDMYDKAINNIDLIIPLITLRFKNKNLIIDHIHTMNDKSMRTRDNRLNCIELFKSKLKSTPNDLKLFNYIINDLSKELKDFEEFDYKKYSDRFIQNL